MGTNKSGEKGQTIIVVALMITVLLLFVGFAIDSGIGYGVKAKLSSAVDAAALAAGKALGDPAADDDQRKANAKLAARTFFAANFPNGYLMATPTLQDPVIDHDLTTGQWNITVTATATEPTIFLKLADRKTFTAQAVAGAIRRDLDMAFVIDNTGSIAENPADPQRVREAAKFFVSRFIPSSDRMALLRFAFGAQVMDQIRTLSRGFDNTSVVNHINNMSFHGNTNFSEAFWRGWEQLDSIPSESRSSLRAIVFFSDGSPNSFTSTFHHPPPPVVTDHTGVIVTGDNPGGDPDGLWEPGNIDNRSSAPWNSGNLHTYAPILPQWFNLGAGTPSDGKFPVWPVLAGGPLKQRAVPSPGATNYANVNNAARNLPEYMANETRKAGIFVFTLGLGQRLTELSGQNNERGDTVLKRMANDPTADTYNPSQPVGLYCFAADAGDPLKQCFDKVASKILRLSR